MSTFKGKNPVVLFFYPKAATPGCTKEVRGGRRRSACCVSREISRIRFDSKPLWCRKALVDVAVQACKFRDEYDRFKQAGAVVFGISSGKGVRI